MGGVNKLPPVGLMVFSVGATVGDGEGVVVVVVVVVVVSGASDSSVPQAAVSAPMEIMAARPAVAPRRRAKRADFMMQSYLYSAGSRFATRWSAAMP
jgi:hypothetical protein